MALHGLAQITIGVPCVERTRRFYREFGLDPSSGGGFATADGGDQLRIVEHPVRSLLEYVVAADDPADVARVRRAAEHEGIAVDGTAQAISLRDPTTGIAVHVAILPRIKQEPAAASSVNGPGSTARIGVRADAIFPPEVIQPRRLGHVALAVTDAEATKRFLVTVLGFRLTDSVPGIIEFFRCSSDHHNVALLSSAIPFLHHTSWQVDDADQIGHAATKLLAVDPTRDVWGLGRHFLGSNLFWYLRDPAGNFAEYFADMDQIADDDAWVAQTWDPAKALYIWGPPVPAQFIKPEDLDELSSAYTAATSR